MNNPLREIMRLGQSVWYDNIRRAMLDGGDLLRKIEEDDLRGVTSNPTIFEKAITGSADYDEQMAALTRAGRSAEEIYEELVAEDIGRAADVFRAVYDRTDGLDGYISLEVNPRLAYDTDATIAEAERLFRRLGRKNVMIKIPAAPEGIPAIEESIRRGVNINVTMIFSIENYEQVAGAFIRGLERRLAAGETVDHIASVASFFVSRVDTSVDAELERMAREAGDAAGRAKYESLLGRAGVANAKLAYQKFREIFHGERFAALRAAGAQVQRPLWASTGTKNPKYSDVLYVDNLIGPETVNTLPPATYTAVRDHGRAALTLEEGVGESRALFDELREAGIDVGAVTKKLQEDGLSAFVKSFDALLESIRAKRAALLSGVNERLSASLGKHSGAVTEALREAEAEDAVRRIWRKDASLWMKTAEHERNINKSLGWLTVVGEMKGVVDELKTFADDVRGAGFRHVMVCGMGGSSLCPEVLRRTFGPQPGCPELLVLDSTDPDAVAALGDRIDVARTLFVIASKSGTTTEPLAFHKYWYAEVGKVKDDPGENFVAITDPGTALAQDAERDGFRRVFLNPHDIGGRYSALSYFGLLPAALMGLDVGKLLDRAERVVNACAPAVPPAENPGARLGAIVAACARAGRDKLTIVADGRVDSLGLWVEQLIAESTGKEGEGVIPVAGETLGPPPVYGDDRLFVSIAVETPGGETGEKLRVLEAAGHPVVYRRLTDLYDLGEEFFLWEFATAFAGWRLGVNPFNQPNVQESKLATKELLEAFGRDGRLSTPEVLVGDGALTIYAAAEPGRGLPAASVADAVRAHLEGAEEGRYIALLNYVEELPAHEEAIEELRALLRDSTRCATTAGYGPRYLHSTGQLHKGGPATGVFIQLTAPDRVDLPVPGQPYTFSALKDAQALGDFRSLTTHGLPAIRIDLGADVAAGLRRLRDVVADAVAGRAGREASLAPARS